MLPATALLAGMLLPVGAGQDWVRWVALAVGMALQVPIYFLSPAARRPRVLTITLPLTFAFLVGFSWILEIFFPQTETAALSRYLWLGILAGILDIILYQRPPCIDLSSPPRSRKATVEVDTEGGPWAVRADGRSAWWLTGLDPQEKLADLVASLSPSGPVSADLRDGYWRVYALQDEGDAAGPRFVLAMARSRRRMDGIVRAAGREARIGGTGMVALKLEAGEVVDAIGEEIDVLEQAGRPVPWRPIEPGPRVERKHWSLPAQPLSTTLNRD